MRFFIEATITCFRKYAVFSGRAGRSEFWYFLLFFFVAYVAVILADLAFVPPIVTLSELPGGHLLPLSYAQDEVGLLLLLYRPVMGLPSAAVTVRRLHDIGKSGWWGWLWILPFPVLGWLVLIPWLARASDERPNAFGAASG
jgi:uncharacterized membrane protein YhaH (DUF805 family)